jgi:hypothetical protein
MMAVVVITATALCELMTLSMINIPALLSKNKLAPIHVVYDEYLLVLACCILMVNIDVLLNSL